MESKYPPAFFSSVNSHIAQDCSSRTLGKSWYLKSIEEFLEDVDQNQQIPSQDNQVHILKSAVPVILDDDVGHSEPLSGPIISSHPIEANQSTELVAAEETATLKSQQKHFRQISQLKLGRKQLEEELGTICQSVDALKEEQTLQREVLKHVDELILSRDEELMLAKERLLLLYERAQGALAISLTLDLSSNSSIDSCSVSRCSSENEDSSSVPTISSAVPNLGTSDPFQYRAKLKHIVTFEESMQSAWVRLRKGLLLKVRNNGAAGFGIANTKSRRASINLNLVGGILPAGLQPNQSRKIQINERPTRRLSNHRRSST